MGSVRLPKGEYSSISLEFAGDGIICEYAASVSDGDVFTVGSGQLALVICDGRIMSLCGAKGAYVYDMKREPSCFTGNFPVYLNEVFRENRGTFSFAGEHRLIYFRMDELCCTGAPVNSTIAIGSHGCIRLLQERKHFIQGLDYVVNRLKPKTIIVYGTAPDAIFSKYKEAGITILQFDSDYMIAHKKAVNA